MTYQVAIPSYRRADLLMTATLPLLRERCVPDSRVTVFVADDDERAEYARALPAGFGGELVVATPGMGAVRNWINDWYPDGTRLVQVDDDVRDAFRKTGPNDAEPITDLNWLFADMFETLDRVGLTLWGVYAVANPYFMSYKDSVDLKYVVGALWGVINEHAAHCRVDLDDKEDYQRTILHYLHAGGVLRRNSVGIKTRYYKQPGGMQVSRTEERVTASAHELNRRYPDLAHINTTKKSGHVEIRLRDKRRRIGVHPDRG